MSKQRKIVIALDPSSEEASYTVDWIIDNFLMSERDDVHLISALCLNSDLDITELGLNVNYAAEYAANLEKEVERKTSDAMQPFAKKLEAANIKCKVDIISSNNDSRNIVVDYTEKEKADVLIMGSRDLSTWKSLFLGSFSDFCHHNAHCPVLIVKGPRESS
uniref:Universal stress protein MJ0531 n=1 Tax=Anthurium amnicola TaxID=1678845 RepID=A0A1D1XVA6_9ARAE